jgi:hypothetical protein
MNARVDSGYTFSAGGPHEGGRGRLGVSHAGTWSPSASMSLVISVSITCLRWYLAGSFTVKEALYLFIIS